MRRTLYLGMACLLSALSVAGQTGSRDLNPIEKQKLQLPELPVSQARSSMLRSGGNVDYTKGTFIVNEDWYGHQNSSVNFLSDDGTWTYNAFQKENPGHELGCTSQFGAIYGDLLYIVSKQEKDPGASVTGSRLAVIDAKTMEVKKEFTSINGADGRSFVGVDVTKGYIGTSNGIYIYHTGYNESDGTYDIEKMSIETTAIAGTTGVSSSDLYHSQIGTMVRVGKYVFAVHQTKGLLVIDPEEDKVIDTILKPEEDSNHGLGSIVLSKDGNLWASVTLELTGTGATMPYLWKVNPYTLTAQKIDIPTSDGIEEIPNSWYAWTADGFCASTKENKIYWKGQGSGSWFTGYKIFCYDIDKDSFYQVFDFTKLDKGDWRLYGTGFRIDPVDDNMYCFLYHEFLNPEHELAIIKTDGRGDTNGTMVDRYPYEKVNYWFPALPVFPDNIAPTITDGLPSEITFSAENTKFSKSMAEIVEDGDNMLAAITMTYLPKSDFIDVLINNNALEIMPVKEIESEAMDIPVEIVFNSNGKIAKKNITVKLSKGATAPFEMREEKISLMGKNETVKLSVNALADENIKWSSAHPEIATVSNDGTVTSVAYGTVEITATSEKRPTLSSVCTVTVKRPTMTFKESSVELYAGKNQILQPIDNRPDPTTETIEWTSSDKNIATVSGGPYSASITAVSEGQADIIATIKSNVTGEIMSVSKCKVIVKKTIPVERIELKLYPSGNLVTEEPISIDINSSVKLIANVYPENASDKDLEWISDKPTAFAPQSDGEREAILAKQDGTATITVTSGNGISASCRVQCDIEYEGASFEQDIVGFKVDPDVIRSGLAKIKFKPAKPSYIEISDVYFTDMEVQEGEEEFWYVSKTAGDDNTITIEPSYGDLPGSATVNAKLLNKRTNQEEIISCKFIATEEWVTSFKLNETSKVLKTGETFQLTPEIDWGSVIPNSLSVKYSVEDNKIISVSDEGLVTALKQGKTTVRAYLSDGSFSEVCDFVVADILAKKVIVKEKEVFLKLNETKQLSAVIQPEDASFGPILWSGFSLTENGFFEGHSRVSKHLAIATSADGLAADTCIVYVEGDIPLESFSVEPKELSVDKSESDGNKSINLLGKLKFSYSPMNASILYDIDAKNPEINSIEDESVFGKVQINVQESQYKAKKVGTTKIIIGPHGSQKQDEILLHITDKSLGVLGVTLEASQMTISQGDEITLEHIVQTDASKPDVDTSVTWSSSDETVATVDPVSGKIRALKNNDVTVIRVATNTGNFVAACTLSVGTGIVKVTGVSLNQDRLELTVGHSAQLVASVTPSDAKTKTVNWSSDNRLVVDVDKDGNVLANGEGTAIVTATTLDGGYTATCKVIVSAGSEEPGTNVTGVSLNTSSLSLKKGEEAVLAAVISPSSAVNKSVTWSSSDAMVAMVGSDGTVKAGIAGVAIITVTTDEGGYTATCEVTVIDPDLEKPEVEVSDSTAILIFPKVPETTFYEISVYKYVNEIPVLFGVYTVDAEGNILTGLMSELRSGELEKIKVSIPELDGNSEYIVKVTAIKESDGKQEILGAFYSEPFSTSGTVDNETIGTTEVEIYYQDGQLYLNNLKGYHCYIISLNGAILDIFEVTGINESRLISYSRGAYIITLVKDDDRISKKIVINK